MTFHMFAHASFSVRPIEKLAMPTATGANTSSIWAIEMSVYWYGVAVNLAASAQSWTTPIQ
jgi:hypothetical protein